MPGRVSVLTIRDAAILALAFEPYAFVAFQVPLALAQVAPVA